MANAIPPVLVVDDNPELVELIEMLLLNSGYHAVAVHCSSQALALAEQERFSALFTDLMMPGMSGHELIRAVRATTHNQDLPVVIMSGLAMSDQTSHQPGVHHLEKPFSLADFNKMLEQVMVGQAVD